MATDREYKNVIRQTDGLPTFIMVAEIQPAERAAFPHAIMFNMPYEAVRDRLPGSKELQRVSKLEEGLMKQLEGPNGVFAGHVIGFGRQLSVFYCRSAITSPMTVKTGLLSKETLTPTCKHDPEWTFFAEHLEATAQEVQMTRNLPLHQTLQENGDDFTKPRVVDFGVEFPDSNRRAAFLSEAVALGYTYDEAALADNDDFVELHRTTSIEPKVIAQMGLELDELARKHGGEFDGWACPVTK
jgi:uncharacterized protein (TIGR01619 family)